MPVGPIQYRRVREVLQESRQQESHPLPRVLAEYLLDALAGMQCDEQELAQMTCTLLTDVMECCCRLSTDLINRRRHPVVPENPQEQERLWNEADAELRRWYGYADVTEAVRDWYARDAASQSKLSYFDYRAVYRSAESVQYVRSLSDLLIVLDEARQADADQQSPDEPTTPQEEEDDAPRL